MVPQKGSIAHHGHAGHIEAAEVHVDAGEDVARRKEAPVSHLSTEPGNLAKKITIPAYFRRFFGDSGTQKTQN